MTYAEHFRELTGRDMTKAQEAQASGIVDIATAKRNLEAQIGSAIDVVRDATGLPVTAADIAPRLTTTGSVSRVSPGSAGRFVDAIPAERLIELARQDLDPVIWAFRRYLNRTPEESGYRYYTNQINNGRPEWEVIREIELSDEAESK
jgi:hypothetical protein